MGLSDEPSSSLLSLGYHHIRRRQVVFRLIEEKLRLKKAETLVCDVGCGDGWYTIPLKEHGYSVVGIDVSKKSLKRVKVIVENIDVVRGDVNFMPFKKSVFHLVVCAQLLEHVLSPFRVVGECKRITGKGNFLLFEVPSKSNILDFMVKKLLRLNHAPWTTWGLTIDPSHLHFFSQEELLKIFSANELDIMEIKGAIALRYALPGLSAMFFDRKKRWWVFLDVIESIISSIPILNRLGAIQTFLLRNPK